MLRSMLALTLCCAALPAFADAPPTGVPVQLAMFDGPTANSCLHVPEPPDYGYKVMQGQCLTVGDAQMFEFEAIVQGGYQIRSVKSQGCLEPEGGPLILALPCNGAVAQRWDVNYSDGNPNTAMFRNQATGMCLDFNAQVAVQSACDFGAGQGPTWMVSRQAARVPVGAMGVAAFIDGTCMSLGEFPVSVECNNDRDSSLRFVPLDATASTFRFDGPVDGTCLMDGGDAIVYDACVAGLNSQWRIVEVGFYSQAPGPMRALWQLQNVGTGQCLHARRGAIVPDGETVTPWLCDASDNAKWQFVKY